MSRREGSGSPGLSGPMRQPSSVPLHCAVCQQRGVGREALGVKAPSSLGSNQKTAWALLPLPSFPSVSLSGLLGHHQSLLHNATERKKPSVRPAGKSGWAAGCSLCCFPNGTQAFSQDQWAPDGRQLSCWHLNVFHLLCKVAGRDPPCPWPAVWTPKPGHSRGKVF